VVIVNVESGAPAEEAGLTRGDVIQEVNRKPVRSLKEYEQVVSKIKKDDSALLLLFRQGRTFFVTLTP
jgi:serine protease Do